MGVNSNEHTRESAIHRRNCNSHLPGLFNFGRLSDMNKTIGIAVAKTLLFEIIDRVEFGETIIIARNGVPVAQLRPLVTRTTGRREGQPSHRATGSQTKQSPAVLAAERHELS